MFFKKLFSGASPTSTSDDRARLRAKGIKKMDANIARKLQQGGPRYSMKCVIRGDKETGKSTFMRRLQGGDFTAEHRPTPEIQTAHINWNYKATDEVVMVEVWDVVDKGKSRVVDANFPAAAKSPSGTKPPGERRSFFGGSKSAATPEIAKTPKSPKEEGKEGTRSSEADQTQQQKDATKTPSSTEAAGGAGAAAAAGAGGGGGGAKAALPEGKIVLPPLDASFVDVYQGANAVVFLVDPTRTWTLDYVVKELPHVPSELEILILVNFRDLGRKRVVSEEDMEQFMRTQPPRVRYVESSLKNGFGLRQFYNFLNVPFLKLKMKALQVQLEDAQRELEGAEKEMDIVLEQDYDTYIKWLEIQAAKDPVLDAKMKKEKEEEAKEREAAKAAKVRERAKAEEEKQHELSEKEFAAKKAAAAAAEAEAKAAAAAAAAVDSDTDSSS
eukprot:CAMPEP_0175144206 /NCGR_PEP_ID=MMETSP0087-20121206/13977_1 /TAXON_ID=136419 /ORGANISM="Unknown Unknown, Strain D1" /LENGTH=441 /DNA_ID=CAMNT_0016428597 /DNA_START=37 /DNA_END=1358 /DNA_ORIENTATION=+